MTNYEKLIDTLKEVFMLDKAELDFGIYRIMNQKRKDIEQFLERDLLPQVRNILSESLSIDKQALQKELDDAIKSAEVLGADPESLPKVMQLRERLGEAGDMESIENDVFSHLSNFFKRYYDNGDFISMRRYKKDVYAIPYEGEEVKLHWANADQYYIKTSEYFKKYTFKLSDGKKVTFELVEASTEQNNNVIQKDKERQFAIYPEKPCETIENEFKIYFTYDISDKKLKQSALLEEAFEIIKSKIPRDYIGLLSLKPTEKDKQRTLLQKHLVDYTARNTFDYFIHKDLYGFLSRELDFYIKNEVLYIDDINTRNEQEFLKQLSKIKAVKKIGEKIIMFLAQLENFQKKLWLKKKMVVECNYCITLDRVPEALYTEIIKNKEQINEWVSLFAIDEIIKEEAEGIFTDGFVGYSNPPSIDFLKQNPYLVLDTVFFKEDFKWKLITSIENFDDKCDGLLINSENYQSMFLLLERYKGKVKTNYQDPPYNTSASEILYKNSFKHSSWVSFMYDKLELSKSFLKDEGILCITIDDFEQFRLKAILEHIYSSNHLGTLCIRNNPAGRSTTKGVSITHEYALLYGKTDKGCVGRLERNQEQIDRYDQEDTSGKFEWVNFRKPGSMRSESPSMYYPLIISGQKVIIPNMEYNNENKEWKLLQNLKKEEILIYPIDENNQERRWRWGIDRTKKELSELKVSLDRNKQLGIYSKGRLNEDGILPLTWWDDKKYSSTAYGTNMLKDIFLSLQSFSYPKSLYAVMDSLEVSSLKGNDIVMDIFSGSGTTGHAVIELNREDQGNRKYILIEMGEYFDSATKPRIQKIIYSRDWKDGKPVSREGISQCFKYMRLESYEDTLNNLVLKQTENQQQALNISTQFKEGYMLNYILDVETKDSLLNLEWFVNPFECYLNTAKNNEIKPTKVDLVETFNYLIGLVVDSYSTPKDGYKIVTGKTLDDEKILVVWRDCKKYDNAALNKFLEKSKYNPLDNEYNKIYVNGDNNVENLKIGDEQWKVVLIEEEFKKRMFKNT